ncbi:hypothetical protein Tco_0842646 [Tanacetum coccineum]|uniref:Uncharacterized protein n=1 Tax=Tanacetum coccineum TaxID=301880 RepID=A0ABQ5B5I2_9ASTR
MDLGIREASSTTLNTEQMDADFIATKLILKVEYIHKQETVKEAVTASVQYAMRAPLRARFKDLPTSDMKEILLQHMLEENYDKGHEDHWMAYEAFQYQFFVMKDSPKTPPESPPPPPPSGASGASGTTGASDSAQDPLPPPQSPTTNPDDQSPGLAAPGSSKTAATTAYTAWTMTTSRFEPLPHLFMMRYYALKECRFESSDMVSDDEKISADNEATQYNVSRPLPLGGIQSRQIRRVSSSQRFGLYTIWQHRVTDLRINTKNEGGILLMGLEQMVPDSEVDKEEPVHARTKILGLSKCRTVQRQSMMKALDSIGKEFKVNKETNQTQAGSPPSMCQTISNIDAHVEGEQFHESKQSRYEFPRSRQSRRDLPRDNSLVSVEVLRYDYKRSNVNKGIVRTKMELVLEHTQQGTSNEVSVSTEGVEE